MIEIERRTHSRGGDVFSYKDHHYSSYIQALIKWTYSENNDKDSINYRDLINNHFKVPISALGMVLKDPPTYSRVRKVAKYWRLALNK